MTKQHRRKYRNIRLQMKKDFKVLAENNITLQLLIRDVMLLYKARRLEHKVWHIIGTKYKDIYIKEFCDSGLVGKSMCGRFDEFFDTMYFIDKEFTLKYKYLIPDTIALGDAYGVCVDIWRKNKIT